MTIHRLHANVLKACLLWNLLAIYIALPAFAQTALPITTRSPQALQQFKTGLEHYNNFNLDDARAGFDAAIVEDSAFAQAFLYRALTARSHSEQAPYLRRIQTLSPALPLPERQYIRGWHALLDRDYAMASGLIDSLTITLPQEKRVWHALGEKFARQKMPNLAMTAFRKALALDRQYARALNAIGYAFLDQNDLNRAERTFKDLTALLPNNASPFEALGDLYMRIRRHDDAISMYGEAVSRDPTAIAAQRKIGSSHMLKGEYAQARRALAAADSMAVPLTDRLWCRYYAAFSWLYEDKLDTCLSLIDKALACAEEAGLDGWVAQIHARKTFILTDAGRPVAAEESAAACMAAIRRSGVRAAIIEIYRQSGFAKRALIAAIRADFSQAYALADSFGALLDKETQPRDLRAYHAVLGQIAFHKGNIGEAGRHFDIAKDYNDYASFIRAQVELQRGNLETAKAIFDKLVRPERITLFHAIVFSRANRYLAEIKMMQDSATPDLNEARE